MIESAMVAYLRAHAAVSPLLGSRIYPLVLPQNVAYPAARYQRIDTPRPHSKQGASRDAWPRVQVDVWSPTYGEAKVTAEQVRLAMGAFLGIRAGQRVVSVVCQDEQDDYEAEPSPGVYRVTLDFIIGIDE